MVRFAKFQNGLGQPIYINPETISSIGSYLENYLEKESTSATNIRTVDGKEHRVVESIEVVLEHCKD